MFSRYPADFVEDFGEWSGNCDRGDNSSKTPAEPSFRCGTRQHALDEKPPSSGSLHDIEGERRQHAVQSSFQPGKGRLGTDQMS